MNVNLSIITVVLNDRIGIERTYKSLVNYLKIPFEWIVVDGVSTDGTLEYMYSISPEFKCDITSEQDNGLYDAMNKGIKKASGNYLLFLNAGDYINDSNELDNLIDEKAEILVFNIDTVDAELKPSKYRSFKSSGKYLARYPSVPHQSTLIHRRVFKKIGFYDLNFKYLADYDFFCKAYSKKISFRFFPNNKLSVFVQNGVSTDLANIEVFKKESIYIQKKYFGKVYYMWILELNIKSILSILPNSNKFIHVLREKMFN